MSGTAAKKEKKEKKEKGDGAAKKVVKKKSSGKLKQSKSSSSTTAAASGSPTVVTDDANIEERKTQVRKRQKSFQKLEYAEDGTRDWAAPLCGCFQNPWDSGKAIWSCVTTLGAWASAGWVHMRMRSSIFRGPGLTKNEGMCCFLSSCFFFFSFLVRLLLPQLLTSIFSSIFSYTVSFHVSFPHSRRRYRDHGLLYVVDVVLYLLLVLLLYSYAYGVCQRETYQGKLEGCGVVVIVCCCFIVPSSRG